MVKTKKTVTAVLNAWLTLTNLCAERDNNSNNTYTNNYIKENYTHGAFVK